MSELNTKTVLQSRMECFTKWIAPDPDKKKEIFAKADEIRQYIKQTAEENGLTVKSMPIAGSSAKGNGLRRHYRGHSEVDGWDIDIPIVVKMDEQADLLNSLLDKFEQYAIKSYPNTTIEKTKSSVKLHFSKKGSFDLVPMLATEKSDEQILVRRDGERIATSVQKHNEFIKGRTKKSRAIDGVVKFNQCIQLLKWWKEFQADNSYYLGYNDITKIDNVPPSILIDLLCALAFDKLGVQETYAETMAKWCGYLAHIIRNRVPVFFPDYYATPDITKVVVWTVLDPVNPENNIVKKWDSTKVNELADWFENARDNWNRIIHFNEDGDDGKALEILTELFGNPFKNHCGDE